MKAWQWPASTWSGLPKDRTGEGSSGINSTPGEQGEESRDIKPILPEYLCCKAMKVHRFIL